MIRRPPRSTLSSSSAASDVYKRQRLHDPERRGLRSAHSGREPPLLRRGLRRGGGRAGRARPGDRRSRRPAVLDRRDALRRSASPPFPRVRARPPAASPVPGRADGRGRSALAGPVLGPFPGPERRGHHDRRLESRHGRGGPLPRAPVRPFGQDHGPGDRPGDPGARRHRRSRAGVPPPRRECRGDPMSRRRVVALFRRVVSEIRRDRPSLALLFIAPIVITGLVTFILRESQVPQVTAVVVNLAGPRGQAVGDALGAALRTGGATVTDVADEGVARASIADTSASVGIVLRAGAATGSALDITVITNGLDPSGDAGQVSAVQRSVLAAVTSASGTAMPVIDHTTIYGTPTDDPVTTFAPAIVAFFALSLIHISEPTRP